MNVESFISIILIKLKINHDPLQKQFKDKFEEVLRKTKMSKDKSTLNYIKLGQANRDLLKIVEMILYFINKGKITAHNFKKLKYLMYFANFNHYEQYFRPIVKIHFYKSKTGDIEIRLK